jgi:hypothetical protein
MPNISSIIKNVRNIMRQDRGVSGDAQRLEQLGWLLFLKILDEKDQELELIRDRYRSVIPDKFQWRNWAADAEGITGEELILFIDHPTDGLFTTLKGLKAPHAPQRAALVREVFDGSNNYMKSGYEMRKVINQLNGFDFNNSDDRHIFGTVYESILLELRDAGNKGEYYTPRAITQLMTQMTAPRLGEKVLDPAAGTGGFLSAAIDYIREKEVRTLDDEAILQKTITGWELKPVSYVLGLTNLILHGLEVPDWHYRDSLKTEYNAIGPKQQVDVILANPPFGASIADGVQLPPVLPLSGIRRPLHHPHGPVAQARWPLCHRVARWLYHRRWIQGTHPRKTPHRLQPPHHRPPAPVHLPPRHRFHQPALLPERHPHQGNLVLRTPPARRAKELLQNQVHTVRRVCAHDGMVGKPGRVRGCMAGKCRGLETRVRFGCEESDFILRGTRIERARLPQGIS